MSEVVQKQGHVTTWPVPDGLNGANGHLARQPVAHQDVKHALALV